MKDRFEVRMIGRVESSLVERSGAPRQPDEGAPFAWLVFEPDVRDALDGLQVGDEVIVITWLDRADRSVLRVRPRSDATRPLQGVFSTRAPDRPNPIGLHTTTIASIDGLRVQLSALEAIDGTPVLDLKPVLNPDVQRR